MLRNFLYLDTVALDQYLSQLEGSLVEDIDQKITRKRSAGAGARIAGTGAKVGGGREVEVLEKRAMPPSARFQRLYDLLTKRDDIQYLDAFDENIWQQLKRGELLEIQAKIRLPEPVIFMQQIQSLQPVIEIMKRFGNDPLEDPKTKEAYTAYIELVSNRENKELPIVFEAVSTPSYTFASSLKKEFLLAADKNMKGEATVVGKITRILQRGTREELVSVVPEVTNLVRSLNRQQRRKRGTSAPPSQIAENIEGPAIILSVLAVYT